MLGKLIKYDFKAMSHVMFPIYLATIAATLIFSLMVKLHFEEGIIFSIFAFLFIIGLFGSMFATVFFVVSRFTRGLLKNEGYLSFALPVDTATHIIAKVINALIWGLFEGLLLLVCFLIMGLFMGSIEGVREFIEEAIKALGLIDKDVLFAMLRVWLIITLEMISSITLIYAGFAVAHLFDKHQKLVMVIFFVIVSSVRSSIIQIFVTMSRYSDPFRNIFWYLVPVLFTAIYSAITWYILDRRLNLE